MKKFKFLTLWILVLSMVLSSAVSFAEEESDTSDENIQEDTTYVEEQYEEILPEDELDDVEFITEDTSSLYNPAAAEQSTTVEEPLTLSAEEMAKIKEENEQARFSQYYKVSSVMKNLGIYSFVDVDQEENVTRGQFAKMIVDLFDLNQETATAADDVFSDIADSPYKNEISLVSYYGIMNGVGNSAFSPDSKITYIQAVKTIVTALGYAPIAENWGGYKDGYIRVALNLKLLKGSNENLDEPITFLTAANLIALSSRSTVLEPVGIKGESVVYNDAPQKTVLAVYHKIYEDKGIMSDNGISAIGKESEVGLNSTVIGDRTLVGMKNSFRDYLGCNVRYFYKSENGDDKLLFTTTEGVSNNIVTIHANELLTDSSEFSANKVIAYVNEKKQSYTIHQYADFMYNGVIDATFHNDSMKINSGTLTLIDADGDNIYELVKAWEYSDIVVDNVLAPDEKLTSKYGDKKYGNINYGEYDIAIFENAYGEEITPEEISEGSVLSVFGSKEKSYIKFVISTQTDDINVSATEVESNGVKIFYDNGNAELSYTYFVLSRENSRIYPIPKSGHEYKLFFNYEGYIAMITLAEDREEYAYALAMAYGKGLRSDKVDIKLYFENNNYAVVPVANKLTINGVKNRTGADLISDERIYKNGAIVPQLVKITLNSKGELSSIWIDDIVDANVYGFNLDEFSLDFFSDGSMKGEMSAAGNRFINRAYRITSETKIFLTEGMDSKLQVTEEDNIRVISYLDYVGGASGSKHIKMYDADATWQCGAVVISEVQGLSSRSFTVDKVTHITDEDGEDKISVTGYFNGSYRVLREDDGGRLAAEVIKRYPESNGRVYAGDVFEILLDVNGEICNAKLCYSPKRDKDREYCFVDIFHSSSGDVINTNNQVYILGYPMSVEDSAIGVYSSENPDYVPLYNSNQSGGSSEMFFVHPFNSSASILKYDCETDSVEKISVDDLYGVAQLTSQGYEINDKSVKVFFRKTSGQIYDLLLVTNIGN